MEFTNVLEKMLFRCKPGKFNMVSLKYNKNPQCIL